LHVGIDVAKRTFDVHWLETQQSMSFEMTASQIKRCVRMLKKERPVLIVLEATGGYEAELVWALQAAGLPVAAVNPRRIREFAKAIGRTAKTDPIDAQVIALYGAKLEPAVQRPTGTQQRQLKALVARRKQLVTMRTAERNRREHVHDRVIDRSVSAVIRSIDNEIQNVEDHIREHIEQTPALKQKAALLKGVPGIGETTASMLVTEVPELGSANKREIAALVGVAPMNRDSGQFRGRRMTGGGRREVRARLYMPTLVATRYNPVIRPFYEHLLDQGKCPMTALVASMRKLLVIMNTMVKNNQPWSPYWA
jgi:transposase